MSIILYLLAVGLGLVVTKPAENLRSLRPQIERFTQVSESSRHSLSKNWNYLDGKIYYGTVMHRFFNSTFHLLDASVKIL